MYAAHSTASFRVPAVVEWDDFLDAVRSNNGRGGAGLGYRTPAEERCTFIGCDGRCATIPTTAPVASVTPVPPVTPIPSVAAETSIETHPEKFLYEVILEKCYELKKPIRASAISYEEYKRWETKQSAEFIYTTTPFERITRYITFERLGYLQWNCLPGIEYDKIILLYRLFPRRNLMEMKNIIFPLYQQWRKTMTFPPKTNRWQMMKQFKADYCSLI